MRRTRDEDAAPETWGTPAGAPQRVQGPPVVRREGPIEPAPPLAIPGLDNHPDVSADTWSEIASDGEISGSQAPTLGYEPETGPVSLPDLAMEPPPEPGAVEAPGELIAGRYQDLGQLGEGGMGEVRRVKDKVLHRTVAMKVLKGNLMRSERSLARFREEAQVAAQLQHPGIVPVHDLGRLDDGRVYFTMKEVRGITLEFVVDELERALQRGRDRTPQGFTFRRLVDAFHRVCETMAYAHHRQVVHRDLKPANVMLGGFGEVLVLDWGLAKVLQANQDDGDDVEEGDEGGLHTARTEGGAFATRAGAISGTPAYMAPEQARGETDRIGTWTDVWALGVMLYEILTGQPPILGRNAYEIVAKIAADEPIPRPSALVQRVIPAELEALCMSCLTHNIDERPAHAGVIAEAMAAWVDGARRREAAMKLVDSARASLPDVDETLAKAAKDKAEADRGLAALSAKASPEEKAVFWAAQDAAAALEVRAFTMRAEVYQRLRAALSQSPDLPEAHELLAALYQEEHVQAEREGDDAAVRRLEPLLREHDSGRFTAYLRGTGALSLRTEPPGAEVRLYRYVTEQRRMVPEFVRALGHTPLREVPVEMGSYLCEIIAPNCETVRYPVFIERQQHWDGVRPGGSEPTAIQLPPMGSLGSDECYVPSGWFWCGGRETLANLSFPRTRVWADGFVAKRFPVTTGEFLNFLRDLIARGEVERALKWVPGEGLPTGPIARLEGGQLVQGPDLQGTFWEARLPAFGVSFHAAMAFAEWHSDRTGKRWRLPFELEFEKLCRGVDGRLYPWGNFFDPAWAQVRESKVMGPVAVDATPTDVSVFGAFGFAGNAAAWCADAEPQEFEARLDNDVVQTRFAFNAKGRPYRGGSWAGGAIQARSDFRARRHADAPADTLALRLIRGT